ncbi:MAG: ABC transporter ATP-binding protein [Longimicrobiales bacterium]|nr:ABC transporter ATP-binding protein [Longimicrobiales bacterium]
MIIWRADVQARFEGFELDVSLQGDARPLAVVGPNGSGKTTLLRAIAGAVPVTHAHVEIGKTVLESTEPGIHVPIELRRVGYVPQGYGLFPHLTVLENVEFGLSTGPDRPPAETRRTRALEMLIELDCKPLANRHVDRLSGGEQQRIALARALVLEPDLLLLDEPLAALDATRRRAVRHFLAERLQAFGRPSIIVTHDVRDVVALNANIVVLEKGHVVQQGSLASLRQAPVNDFIAEFIGAG